MSEAKLHYSKTRTGERRLKAVKVRLCDWLYRAILLDRHVLDYAAYFQLEPIEQRIYEVARSTCEDDGALDIDLATFRMQIDYQDPLSNFKAALKQLETDRRDQWHSRLPPGAGRGDRGATPRRRCARALRPACAAGPRHHHPRDPALTEATSDEGAGEGAFA